MCISLQDLARQRRQESQLVLQPHAGHRHADTGQVFLHQRPLAGGGGRRRNGEFVEPSSWIPWQLDNCHNVKNDMYLKCSLVYFCGLPVDWPCSPRGWQGRADQLPPLVLDKDTEEPDWRSHLVLHLPPSSAESFHASSALDVLFSAAVYLHDGKHPLLPVGRRQRGLRREGRSH